MSEKQELSRENSRQADAQYSTRKILSIYNDRFHHQVTISSRL